MSLKIFTLIISAGKNSAAKLHSHSLHRSGEINNNNVLKFWLLLDLQAIHCRIAATSETVTKYRNRNCSKCL
jgi:hypothetical protein